MEKFTRAKVKHCLKEAFAKLTPPFEPILDDRVFWINESGILYRSEYPNGYYCFLMILFHSKGRQQFTVECAVSHHKLFPMDLQLMHPIDRPISDIPADSPINSSFRFRLGCFFGKQGDHWWELGYSSNELLNLLVDGDFDEWQRKAATLPQDDEIQKVCDDVISKVTMYAIPFFVKMTDQLNS